MRLDSLDQIFDAIIDLLMKPRPVVFRCPPRDRAPGVKRAFSRTASAVHLAVAFFCQWALRFVYLLTHDLPSPSFRNMRASQRSYSFFFFDSCQKNAKNIKLKPVMQKKIPRRKK